MSDHYMRYPAGLAFNQAGVMGPVLLVARFLLAAEFLTYGVRKFLHPENIYQVIEAHNLPGELVYLVIPGRSVSAWRCSLDSRRGLRQWRCSDFA